jgi:hypothetical protein
MEQQELIPHLFPTEYRKIVAGLCKTFGKAEAIIEAEKLKLSGTLLYHSLLGELYTVWMISGRLDILKRPWGWRAGLQTRAV